MRPAVGELLAAASRRAGLDRLVRPRQLRYAYGSDLADAGNGIDVVADLLGHTSISSSQVYVHQGSAARRSGRGAQPPRADGSSTPVSAPTADARRRRIVAPVRGRVRCACVRRRRGPRQVGRRLATLVGPAVSATGILSGRSWPHPQLGWTPLGGAARAAASAARCVAAGCSRSPGAHGLCRAHRSRQRLRGKTSSPLTRPVSPGPVRSCLVLPAPRSTDVIGIFRPPTRSLPRRRDARRTTRRLEGTGTDHIGDGTYTCRVNRQSFSIDVC